MRYSTYDTVLKCFSMFFPVGIPRWSPFAVQFSPTFPQGAAPLPLHGIFQKENVGLGILEVSEQLKFFISWDTP